MAKIAYRLKNHSWGRQEPENPNANRGRVKYEPGDLIFNLTKAELKEHGDHLDPVEVKDDAEERGKKVAEPVVTVDDEETADPFEDYDWTETLAANLRDVKAYITELDDVTMVSSLQAAEMRSETPRKGVLSACEDRLQELTAGQGEAG